MNKEVMIVVMILFGILGMWMMLQGGWEWCWTTNGYQLCAPR